MGALTDETLRYLGVKKADDATTSLINSCIEELKSAARPASSWRFYEMTTENETTVIGGTPFKSAALAKHLAGCFRAAVMTVTLGAGADRLMRRYAVKDISRAATTSAAASAFVESCADDVQKELCGDPFVAGLSPRFRFSVGYGDLALEYQRDMLALSDARRIGVALSGGGMLVPIKTVTAIIGFGQAGARDVTGCTKCDSINCPYRKDAQ